MRCLKKINKRRDELRHRWTAGFIAVLFFLQAIAPAPSWAVGSGELGQSQLFQDSPLAKLKIPLMFGTVDKIFNPARAKPNQDAPAVIYIQDAHANPDAQRNIARILQILHREKRISGIGLEGAFGEVQPGLIRLFDDAKANQGMVNHLADLGELTGAELFGYQHSLPIQGVDDPTLYEQSFQRYVQVKTDAGVQPFLKGLLKMQEDAERLYCSKELRDFVTARRHWSVSGENAASYFEKLSVLAKQTLGLDLSQPIQQFELPNLVRIIKASEVEKRFDIEKTRMEITALRGLVRQRMPRGFERDFYLKTLGRLQKNPLDRHFLRLTKNTPVLSTRHFFEQLYDLTQKQKLSLLNYPALLDAAGLAILQSEIDAEALFKELKPLERRLEARLASKPETKTTLAQDRKRVLIEKLLRLELSSEDYRQLLILKDRGSASKLLQGYRALLTQNFSEVEVVFPQNAMKAAADFYRLSIERDEWLAKKEAALSAQFSQKHSKQAVVLVAGGFHKDGLLKFFEKEHIAYAVITPRAGVTEGESLYEKVMLGQRSSKPVFQAGSDQLNPEVLFQTGAAYRRELAAPGRRPRIIFEAMHRVWGGQNRTQIEKAFRRAEKAHFFERLLFNSTDSGLEITIPELARSLRIANTGRVTPVVFRAHPVLSSSSKHPGVGFSARGGTAFGGQARPYRLLLGAAAVGAMAADAVQRLQHTRGLSLRRAPAALRSELRDLPLNMLDLTLEQELVVLKEVRSELNKQKTFGNGQLAVGAAFSDVHGGLERLDPMIVDSIIQQALPDLADHEKETMQAAILEALAKPLTTLQEAFAPYGIDLKHDLAGKLFFENLGDLVDRGPAGIETVLRCAELYDLGLSSFITGNHDLYALMALLGFHLPWYEGFNFYGYTDADGSVAEVVASLRRDHPELANDKGWWSRLLKVFVEHQQQQQEEKWKPLYEKVRGKKGKGGLFATVKGHLTPEQQRVWNFFSGWYLVEISTGVKAVGSMSIQWWKELLAGKHDSPNPKENFKGFEELYAEITRQSDFDPETEVNRAWRSAIQMIRDEILPVLEEDFQQQVAQKGQWWRVFDAINYKNYISPERYALDWAIHGDKNKGWGPRTIEEQNELNAKLAALAEKPGTATLPQVDLATFLDDGPQTELLRQVRNFFMRSFNLALRNIYLNSSLHSFLPVVKEGEYKGRFYFEYRGQLYRGNGDTGVPSIWEGLQRIAEETRAIFTKIETEPQNAGKYLQELQEPFRVVTAFYADVTTESKPHNIAWALDTFGPDDFAKWNGFNLLTTGHVPIKSFLELPIDVVHRLFKGFRAGTTLYSDRSWAGVYGRWGGMILSWLKKGLFLRGFRSKESTAIEDHPPTVQVDQGADDDQFTEIPLAENPGIDPGTFVDFTLSNVDRRIAEIERALGRSEMRSADNASVDSIDAIKADYQAGLEQLRTTSEDGELVVPDTEKKSAYQRLVSEVAARILDLTAAAYPQAREDMAVLVARPAGVSNNPDGRLLVKAGAPKLDSVTFFQTTAQKIFGKRWEVLTEDHFSDLMPTLVPTGDIGQIEEFPEAVLAGGADPIFKERLRHYRSQAAATRAIGQLKTDYEQAIGRLWQSIPRRVRSVAGTPHPIFATMQAQTRLADEVLKKIYEFTQQLYPEQARKIALIAFGSQGRGEMHRNSDSEGRVVMAGDNDAPDAAAFIFMATQWIFNSGWRSYRVNAPIEMKLPAADTFANQAGLLSLATEFLDARYLVGEQSLSDASVKFYTQQVKAERSNLTNWIIRVWNGRYQRDGGLEGLYAREPNVKEGTGSMRTMHFARWVAQVSTGEPNAPAAFEALKTQGFLTSHELNKARRAYTFLNLVRAAIAQAQSSESMNGTMTLNTLTVEIQSEVARILKYTDSAKNTAVEKMLNDYYAKSFDLFQFSYRLLRRISEQKNIQPLRDVAIEEEPDSPLPRWGVQVVKRSGFIFHLDKGFEEVAAERPEKTLIPLAKDEGGAAARSDALADSMLLIFIYAAKHGLRLSGDLLDDMSGALPHFIEKFKGSADFRATVLRQFESLLKQKSRVAYVLERMHYLGLLEVLLPGFGSIHLRTRFELDDRMTLDRQVIESIAALENFVFDGVPHLSREPISEAANLFFSELNKSYLSMIRVALLLCVFDDQQFAAVDYQYTSGAAAGRRDVAYAIGEAAWFRQHRNDFIELVRRDAFWHGGLLPDFMQAEIQQKPARWHLFVAASLARLYAQRPEHFWLYPQAVEPAFTALKPALEGRGALEKWLEQQAPLRIKAIENDEVWNSLGKGRNTHVEIEPLLDRLERPRDDAALVTVYNLQALDEPGRLEKMAGVLGANELSIESLPIETTTKNYIVNRFIVNDGLRRFKAGRGFESLKATLNNDMHHALDRGMPIRTLFSKKSILNRYQSTKPLTRQRRAIETQIFFNEAINASRGGLGFVEHVAADRTVLRIETADRPLLLHIQTKLIAAYGVNIHAGSTIDTEGYGYASHIGKRAVNTFILSFEGKALTSEQQDSLKADLEFWLKQDVIDLSQLSRHKDLLLFKGRLERYLADMQAGTVPRIGYVGDVHGYLEALERILTQLKTLNVDQTILGGDYVNRGEQSLAVIDRLRALYESTHSEQTEKMVLLAGNHDLLFIESVLGDAEDDDSPNPNARKTKIFSSWLEVGGWAVIREAAREAAQTRGDTFNNILEGVDISPENVKKIDIDSSTGSGDFIKIVTWAMTQERLRDAAKWLRDHTKLFYDDRHLRRTVHAGFRLDEGGRITVGFEESEDSRANFSMMRADWAMKGKGAAKKRWLRGLLARDEPLVSELVFANGDWAKGIKPQFGDDTALNSFLLQAMMGGVNYAHSEPEESVAEHVKTSTDFGGRILPLDFAMGRNEPGFGAFAIADSDGLRVIGLPPASQGTAAGSSKPIPPLYALAKSRVIAQTQDLLAEVVKAIDQNRRGESRSEIRSTPVQPPQNTLTTLQAAQKWTIRFILSVAQPRKYKLGSWLRAWAEVIQKRLNPPQDSKVAKPALYVAGFDDAEKFKTAWKPMLKALGEGDVHISSQSTDDYLHIEVTPQQGLFSEPVLAGAADPRTLRFAIRRGFGGETNVIRFIELINVPEDMNREKVFAGILGWLQQRGFKEAILDQSTLGGLGAPNDFAQKILTRYLSDEAWPQSWIRHGVAFYQLGDFTQRPGLVGPTAVPDESDRDSARRRMARQVEPDVAPVEPSTSWRDRSEDGVYEASAINGNGKFKIFIYPNGAQPKIVVTRIGQEKQETLRFEGSEMEFNQTPLDANGMAASSVLTHYSLTEGQIGPAGYRGLLDIYAQLSPQLEDFSAVLRQAIAAIPQAGLPSAPPIERMTQLADLLQQKLEESRREIPPLTFAILGSLRAEFQPQGVSLTAVKDEFERTPLDRKVSVPSEIHVAGPTREAVIAAMKVIVDRYLWRDYLRSDPQEMTSADGLPVKFKLMLAPPLSRRSEMRTPAASDGADKPLGYWGRESDMLALELEGGARLHVDASAKASLSSIPGVEPRELKPREKLDLPDSYDEEERDLLNQLVGDMQAVNQFRRIHNAIIAKMYHYDGHGSPGDELVALFSQLTRVFSSLRGVKPPEKMAAQHKFEEISERSAEAKQAGPEQVASFLRNMMHLWEGVPAQAIEHAQSWNELLNWMHTQVNAEIFNFGEMKKPVVDLNFFKKQRRSVSEGALSPRFTRSMNAVSAQLKLGQTWGDRDARVLLDGTSLWVQKKLGNHRAQFYGHFVPPEFDGRVEIVYFDSGLGGSHELRAQLLGKILQRLGFGVKMFDPVYSHSSGFSATLDKSGAKDVQELVEKYRFASELFSATGNLDWRITALTRALEPYRTDKTPQKTIEALHAAWGLSGHWRGFTEFETMMWGKILEAWINKALRFNGRIAHTSVPTAMLEYAYQTDEDDTVAIIDPQGDRIPIGTSEEARVWNPRGDYADVQTRAWPAHAAAIDEALRQTLSTLGLPPMPSFTPETFGQSFINRHFNQVIQQALEAGELSQTETGTLVRNPDYQPKKDPAFFSVIDHWVASDEPQRIESVKMGHVLIGQPLKYVYTGRIGRARLFQTELVIMDQRYQVFLLKTDDVHVAAAFVVSPEGSFQSLTDVAELLTLNNLDLPKDSSNPVVWQASSEFLEEALKQPVVQSTTPGKRLQGIPLLPGQGMGEVTFRSDQPDYQNKIFVGPALDEQNIHILRTANGIIADGGNKTDHLNLRAMAYSRPRVNLAGLDIRQDDQGNFFEWPHGMTRRNGVRQGYAFAYLEPETEPIQVREGDLVMIDGDTGLVYWLGQEAFLKEVFSVLAGFERQSDLKAEDVLAELRPLIDQAFAQERMDIVQLILRHLLIQGTLNTNAKTQMIAPEVSRQVLQTLLPELLGNQRGEEPAVQMRAFLSAVATEFSERLKTAVRDGKQRIQQASRTDQIYYELQSLRKRYLAYKSLSRSLAQAGVPASLQDSEEESLMTTLYASVREALLRVRAKLIADIDQIKAALAEESAAAEGRHYFVLQRLFERIEEFKRLKLWTEALKARAAPLEEVRARLSAKKALERAEHARAFNISLASLNQEDWDLVGSKAANLGWSHPFLAWYNKEYQENVIVPWGQVGTQKMYEAFLNQKIPGAKGEETVKDSLREILASAQDFETQARAVHDLFLSVGFPEERETSEQGAFFMFNLIEGFLRHGNWLAARSTTWIEDRPNVSAAGVFLSFLGLKDMESLKIAILEIWASLFSAPALKYRRDILGQAASAEDQQGVIIQQFIDAGGSGVMTSADISSGDRSVVLINAGPGLGEGIVDGTMDADLYIVDKVSGRILEEGTHKGTKLKKVRVVASGGTEVVDTLEAERQGYTLDDRLVARLVKMAKALEEWFGDVVDVEFAVKDGQIYLLQVRSVPGFKITPKIKADLDRWVLQMESKMPVTLESPIETPRDLEKKLQRLNVMARAGSTAHPIDLGRSVRSLIVNIQTNPVEKTEAADSLSNIENQLRVFLEEPMVRQNYGIVRQLLSEIYLRIYPENMFYNEFPVLESVPVLGFDALYGQVRELLLAPAADSKMPMPQIIQLRRMIRFAVEQEMSGIVKRELLQVDILLENAMRFRLAYRMQSIKSDFETNPREALESLYWVANLADLSGMLPRALPSFAESLMDPKLTYGRLADLLVLFRRIYNETLVNLNKDYQEPAEEVLASSGSAALFINFFKEFVDTTGLQDLRDGIEAGNNFVSAHQGREVHKNSFISESVVVEAEAADETPKVVLISDLAGSANDPRDPSFQIDLTKRDRHGVKGAKIWALAAHGIPVPRGLLVPVATAALAVQTETQDAFRSKIREALTQMTLGGAEAAGERREFGSSEHPLLLSVSSSTALSFKGIPESVTSIGLNKKVVQTMIANGHNEQLAYDLYMRFIESFGMAILGLPKSDFAVIMNAVRRLRNVTRQDLSVEEQKKIIKKYKTYIYHSTGQSLPEDPWQQLWMVIERLQSQTLRPKSISGDWPRGLVIQEMIMGNRNARSGGGTILTTTAENGEVSISGEWLRSAFPEDLSDGSGGAPLNIEQMRGAGGRADLDNIYQQLQAAARTLRNYFGREQEIKFVFENGRLFILRTRDAAEIRKIKTPGFMVSHEKVIAQGIAIRGLFRGIVVSDRTQLTNRAVLERVKDLGLDGVILRAGEGVDFSAMQEADAFIFQGGGTSDQALWAVRENKPAVGGIAADVDIPDGSIVTLDGRTGSIYQGRLNTENETRISQLIGGIPDLRAWPDERIKDKKIFVRVDFNVPLSSQDGSIEDDLRIREALPTIRYLLSKGAKVVLMSHLGRPKGKVVPSMSLEVVSHRLRELLGLHARSVTFSPHVVGAERDALLEAMVPGDVVLLENLRFHDEEEMKKTAEENRAFAAALFGGGVQGYVDDAFGVAHRDAASTVLVPKNIPQAAGFLLLKELRLVKGITESPEHPYAVILGGAKVSDKISTVKSVLEKMEHGDVLILGGGMALNFLYVENNDALPADHPFLEVRTSREIYLEVESILKQARFKGVQVILPVDLKLIPKEIMKATDPLGLARRKQAILTVSETKIRDGVDYAVVPEGVYAVDIGPKTVEQIKSLIAVFKTVFWNGPLGAGDLIDEADATRTIMAELAHAHEYGVETLIGGGDTASEAARLIKKGVVRESHVNISTGGGASIAAIEGRTLSSVGALIEKTAYDSVLNTVSVEQLLGMPEEERVNKLRQIFLSQTFADLSGYSSVWARLYRMFVVPYQDGVGPPQLAAIDGLIHVLDQKNWASVSAPDQAAAIQRLAEETHVSEAWLLEAISPAVDTIEIQNKGVTDDRVYQFVRIQGGRKSVLGTADVSVRGDSLHVNWIENYTVQPTRSGGKIKGIGPALMLAIIEDNPTEDLTARPEGEEARAFHRTIGFEPVVGDTSGLEILSLEDARKFMFKQAVLKASHATLLGPSDETVAEIYRGDKIALINAAAHAINKRAAAIARLSEAEREQREQEPGRGGFRQFVESYLALPEQTRFDIVRAIERPNAVNLGHVQNTHLDILNLLADSGLVVPLELSMIPTTAVSAALEQGSPLVVFLMPYRKVPTRIVSFETYVQEKNESVVRGSHFGVTAEVKNQRETEPGSDYPIFAAQVRTLALESRARIEALAERPTVYPSPETRGKHLNIIKKLSKSGVIIPLGLADLSGDGLTGSSKLMSFIQRLLYEDDAERYVKNTNHRSAQISHLSPAATAALQDEPDFTYPLFVKGLDGLKPEGVAELMNLLLAVKAEHVPRRHRTLLERLSDFGVIVPLKLAVVSSERLGQEGSPLLTFLRLKFQGRSEVRTSSIGVSRSEMRFQTLLTGQGRSFRTFLILTRIAAFNFVEPGFSTHKDFLAKVLFGGTPKAAVPAAVVLDPRIAAMRQVLADPNPGIVSSEAEEVPATVVLVSMQGQLPEIELEALQLAPGSRVLVLDPAGDNKAWDRYGRIRLPGVLLRHAFYRGELPDPALLKSLLAESGSAAARAATRLLLVLPFETSQFLEAYAALFPFENGLLVRTPQQAASDPNLRFALSNLLGRNARFRPAELLRVVPSDIFQVQVHPTTLSLAMIPEGQEDKFTHWGMALAAQELLESAA